MSSVLNHYSVVLKSKLIIIIIYFTTQINIAIENEWIPVATSTAAYNYTCNSCTHLSYSPGRLHHT